VVSVGADAAGRQLDIEISSRTASLEAVVTDDRKRPIVGALVIAVPDVSQRQNSEAFRTAVTDSAGRVKLEGMWPGTYTFFATETLAADAWQDPAVIKRLEARGQMVKLTEGAVLLIELRITP
jgi:hypothetical protein